MGRPQKYSEKDYHSLANLHGFKWLGPFPKNVTIHTKWECSRGHIWDVAFSCLKGCMQCRKDNERHKESDYHKLAHKREFTWLGPLPQNVMTRTKWKCGTGHIWNATFVTILAGHGCRQCHWDRIRHSESDYKAIAQSKNLEWLGPLPPNTKIHTRWKCTNGHIWKTAFKSIWADSGCPKCSGLEKLTESDYKILAQEYGVEWLGPLPKNSNAKTNWRCGRGHILMSAYQSIRSGNNCSQCHRENYRGDKVYNFRGGDGTRRHYGNEWGETKKKQIRMRDEYTCMLTGKRQNGRKHHVHHIVPARIAPSDWKNSTHNLITLSHSKHMWAESNLEESIPLLRKILYDIYGYNFLDMQDYDLSYLSQSSR